MPTPEQPQAPQTSADDQHVQSLLSRLGEVPTDLRDKSASFIAGKYEKLSERYGSTGAKMVLSATVLLLPVPLPGTSLLPIALAESIKQLSGLAAGGGKHITQATETVGSNIRSGLEWLAREVGVSLVELEHAARELLQEALAIDLPEKA